MILEERDEHSGRGDNGVVESVGKAAALFALVADAEAARLRVGEVGAGADFEILLLAGTPCLHVDAAVFEIGKIARAAFERAHGDPHGDEQLDGVIPHPVVPHLALFGLADDDHLLLFELVDAVDAALLDAVRPLLLAETGRIAGERERELLFVERGVHEPPDHGVFARADEIEVFALDLIHHALHLLEAHDARNDVGTDHEGRDAVGESLVDHEIARIGEHRGMEARDVADEIVEPLPRSAAGAVEIDAGKALEDIEMVRHLEIGHLGFQKALPLDVFGIVFADGGIVGDDVGDAHHDGFEARADLLALRLDLRKAGGVGVDLRLDGLRFLRLFLAHERADLFGERVARGAKDVALRLERAALFVESERLVHERELLMLEFLFDVPAHAVGVAAQQGDVDHSFVYLM